MSHRSREFWPFVLAAASLIVTAHIGQTQQSAPPPTASAPLVEVKKSQEPEPVKQLSKREVEDLIEKSFGGQSDEIRRPIRLWIPDIGIAVAAKEGVLARDGLSVRFVDVSLALPAESKVLHGPECTFVLDQAIAEIDGISRRSMMKVELRSKSGTVVITPQGSNEVTGTFRTVTKMVPVIESIPISGPSTALAGAPIGSSMQPKRTVDIRFTFKLDPKAPLADLLPSPNRKPAKLPTPLNEDLTQGQRISNVIDRKDFGEEVGVVGAAEEFSAEAVFFGMAFD